MEPWARVAEAAAAADVEVRPLTSLEDADAAVDVAIATWGEYNVVPRETLRAIQESGNQLLGAVRDDRVIAFALGWFGLDEQGWHLHSHQLAVVPGLRSSGIGYALKLAQRASSLDSGVTRIRWTFDPLRSRNAYFNLTKVGARADAFHRDFYGQMPDDINRGDRSDRLVIRWDLEPEPPSPGRPHEVDAVQRTVRVPEEFDEMRAASPDEAAMAREDVATSFEVAFEDGLEAAGFSRELGYLLVERGAA